MRKLFFAIVLAGALLLGAVAFGQTQNQGSGQGAVACPNDKDGDGICDISGRPVGQGCASGQCGRGFRGGQGPGAGQGQGQGQGQRAGMGGRRGMGMGMGMGRGAANCPYAAGQSAPNAQRNQ